MAKHLTFDDSRLILSDHHGVYIPQIYCSDIDEAEANRLGISFADVETCQAGPDHEWYWEAWQAILDSALLVDDNGDRWTLYQSGDLWEIPADCEIPELF